MTNPITVPRIEYLKVQNYRALKEVELKNITPLTVFLGPNGSGKSTVFDVFAFLSECFTDGLRRACDKRGRLKELRTRGGTEPIVFEIKYREKPDSPVITYHLAIDEKDNKPLVVDEWLQWRRGSYGKPFKFLSFNEGEGDVVSGDMPDEKEKHMPEKLDSPDMLAVNTLGQLAKHPRVGALRRFITGWYLSYLTADSTRTIPEMGPNERLSKTGDNLPNVVQYLQEQHPERLRQILKTLTERVPRLEKVEAEPMPNGQLLLRLKDAPFKEAIMSKYASDGTLKMLAYLAVLYDPEPPQLIGIEEPENQLHPRLLPGLSEECRAASAVSQVMVTTHSPFFINGLKPAELRILYRDENGFTKAVTASEIKKVDHFIKHGATLGDLWMEGHFGIGDPLTNAGGPVNIKKAG
jgi:predicted ATPase